MVRVEIVVFATFVALAVAGHVLGQRLQRYCRPGVAPMPVPGRSFWGWVEFLDRRRYERRALPLVALLWVLAFGIPIGAVLGIMLLIMFAGPR